MNLYAGYFVPNGTDPSGTWSTGNFISPITRYVTSVDFNTHRVVTVDTWAQNHDEIVPLKRSKAMQAVQAERAGATAAASSGGAVPGKLGYFWFSEWLERFPNDWNRSPFDVIGDHLTCSKGGNNWSNCRVDWEHVWHRKPPRMSVNGPTGLGGGVALSVAERIKRDQESEPSMIGVMAGSCAESAGQVIGAARDFYRDTLRSRGVSLGAQPGSAAWQGWNETAHPWLYGGGSQALSAIGIASAGSAAVLHYGPLLAGSTNRIGETGRLGEKALEPLGGRPQVFFKTSRGARFADRLVGNVAHEAKVGRQSDRSGGSPDSTDRGALLAPAAR